MGQSRARPSLLFRSPPALPHHCLAGSGVGTEMVGPGMPGPHSLRMAMHADAVYISLGDHSGSVADARTLWEIMGVV